MTTMEAAETVTTMESMEIVGTTETMAIMDTTETMTIFNELLGDQLLEHSTDDNSQANNYIATNELNGKVVALYFS